MIDGRHADPMSWHAPPPGSRRQHGLDLIGQMVRTRRQRLGWTQAYLEMLAGIDQTVISRIENGKQYGMRWQRFADLIDTLGGLDGPTENPDYFAKAPFGARLPVPERPEVEFDAVDLTDDLDGWEARRERREERERRRRSVRTST